MNMSLLFGSCLVCGAEFSGLIGSIVLTVIHLYYRSCSIETRVECSVLHSQ